MAKPFDKRPVDWLRLPSTISFIEELSTVRKSHSDDYQAVKTINGGANPGTWMHEDVALEATGKSRRSGDGSVMVNATEMAKVFGKKPTDFLKTEQTQNFINQLSEVRKINSTDLVKVVYGDNGGTWMHEDVAKDFLRALSENRSLAEYELVASIRGDNNIGPLLR
jgi:hypothetical protein